MAHLSYIETHVTDHCNLNCRGCGHFSPLCEPRFAAVERVAADLAALARLVDSVGRVHLVGGEPLLHPDVLSFCRVAREAFGDAPISLVTNGLLAPRTKRAFWQGLAENDVRLDNTRYPVALDLARPVSSALAHGVQLKITDRRDTFFRVPLDPLGRSDPAYSFARCRRLFSCPNLSDGRLYPCPVVPYSSAAMRAFGFEAPVGEADFVDLADTTAVHVVDFLAHPIPWCRHCDFSRFEWVPWARSQRSREEWL